MSFFWEKMWQSIATWGKQVAEPSFSVKTGGRALFFEKKGWPSIATWGKQLANPHFSEKTGGRALLGENRFHGENRWQSLISRGK